MLFINKIKSEKKEWCSRKNNVLSEDVHILVFRTGSCFTYMAKRTLPDGIKLRIWRWGDDPRWSMWVQCTQGSLQGKGDQEDESHRRKCEKQRSEGRFQELHWQLREEEGPTSRGAQAAPRRQQNEEMSPQASRENAAQPTQLESWPPELWDDKIVVLQVTPFVLIC